jgi:hypothetical protein
LSLVFNIELIVLILV